MKLIKGLLIVAVLLIILTACGSSSTSTLVGTWYSEEYYSYVNGQGGWYCSQMVFSDESTYIDGDIKEGKYVFSDSQIVFLSGDNEGWDLQVQSLSSNKLMLIGVNDPEEAEKYIKLPEIKNFEAFLDGVWVLKDEDGDIYTVLEFDNDTIYYDGDPYPVHYINGNMIILIDDWNEDLYIRKINDNKIIVYEGCLAESEEVVFERVD